MTTKINRRKALSTTAGLLAGGSVLAAATPAAAEQKRMEKALAYLHLATEELRQAEANKDGHRADAIQLVERAVRQVRLGMKAAA